MDFKELIRKRFSLRKYSEKSVEREKLEQCIEAARMAPSACNSQPWKFVVVDDPELRKKVAEETFGAVVSFNKFVKDAPVLVVQVSEKSNLASWLGGMVKGRNFRVFDCGISAEHFCLQAAELGLGTCMLGWFDEKGVKKLLGIPAGKNIEIIIAVGYPGDEKIPEKNRKPMDEVSSFNRY